MLPNLPDALLLGLDPQRVRSFAVRLGWKPVEGVNRPIHLLNHPKGLLRQLHIPIAGTDKDVTFLMSDVVEKLAEFLNRPACEVLESLLQPPADMVQLREVNADAGVGSVPLPRAIRLLEGTRGLLQAAARGVLAAAPNRDLESKAFVDRCRLGLTQWGGYTFFVNCPFDLTSEAPDPSAETPLARRVTIRLLRALRAGRSGKADEIADADFRAALGMLRPCGKDARLNVSVAWSAELPAPGLPRSVEFSQKSFDAVLAGPAPVATKQRSVTRPPKAAKAG